MKKFGWYLVAVLFVSAVSGVALSAIFPAEASLEAQLAAYGSLENEVVVRDPLDIAKAEAMHRYPETATAIWEAVGGDPQFREVVLRYGIGIIPIVHKYYQSPGPVLKVKDLFRRALGNEARTPEERARWVIQRIAESGENFLRRYELEPDGTAKYQMVKGTWAIAEENTTGAIERVEMKVSTGREVTFSEAVNAGIEVTSIVVGLRMVGALATASRATRAAAFARAGSAGGVRGLLGQTAASLPRVLGVKALKYGTMLFAGYMLVKYPAVATAWMGKLGLALGIDPSTAEVLGWATIILVALNICWPLICLVRFVFGFIFSRKREANPKDTV